MGVPLTWQEWHAIAESRGQTIDRLARENAKLREEIEAAKHDLQVFSMGSVQLEAENAKLRELVRDMLETLYWGDYYLKQTGRTFRPSRYETRMRDLGVEVDA